MATNDLQTIYMGRKGPMFRLALVASIITVFTAGIYRFWMKTRMRRYYWSAIRPGGMPLEYVGLPTEKLMGFLTAVVVLAFYIGIVNLVLMFLSFSIFNGDQPAYLLSFVGLAPVIFFAQYRARRYVLARTRWRGIRFGLEPGVAGFVWRSIFHWLLTIATLGLWWPAKTYFLEKYRADRTYYGNMRMKQGGRWYMLYSAMIHVYLGAFATVGAVYIGQENQQPGMAFVAFLTTLWALYGVAHWKAQSFGLLTETKTLGDVGLKTEPRTGRVLGIYVGGWLLMSLASTAAFMVLGLLLALVAGLGGAALEGIIEGDFDVEDIPTWLPAAVGLMVYFGVFLFYGVLKEIFITLPLYKHFAEVTEIVNPAGLMQVRQRDRDEFAEAEGFADALPLGDAF